MQVRAKDKHIGFGRKPKENSPFERSRLRWEDHTRINFKKQSTNGGGGARAGLI
jgi:hypothetical protein